MKFEESNIETISIQLCGYQPIFDYLSDLPQELYSYINSYYYYYYHFYFCRYCYYYYYYLLL